MRVLIDTPVWSLALRRRSRELGPEEGRLVAAWRSLIADGLAVLAGPVRQEVLSGIRDEAAFHKVRHGLAGLATLPATEEDHDEAALFYNRCRAAGIAGSGADFLICALARRADLAIMTTDRDFERYAAHVPIRLHLAGGTR